MSATQLLKRCVSFGVLPVAFAALFCASVVHAEESSNKVSKERFRGLLDKTDTTHSIDEDGDFKVPMAADEDCKYDVTVFFCLQNSSIRTVAYAYDFKVGTADHTKALLFCNEWNSEKSVPKAFFNEKTGRVAAEWTTWTDVDLSDEYIEENIIIIGQSSSWNFFKAAAKALAPAEQK